MPNQLSNTIQQVVAFTWPMVIISVVIMVSFRIAYLIMNKEKFISKWQRDEYGFLKTLADYWRVYHSDSDGQIASDVNAWWWEANNYIWDNYPPLYWGYADLFNEATIEYVPQYY